MKSDRKNTFLNLSKKVELGLASDEELMEYMMILTHLNRFEELSQIELEKEKTEVLKKLKDINQYNIKKGDKKNNSFMLRTIVSVAAALALFIISFFVLDRSKLQVYKTDFGETKMIVLDDGSQVRLNANSTLYWSENWKKQKMRKLQLKGEAFFNIRRTEDSIPFVVQTDNIDINVLGTSFNVFERNGLTEIFLNEGKVNLSFNQGDLSPIHMIPGQKIEMYDSATYKTFDNETLETSASWVKGYFDFKNENFGKIIKVLKDYYGVEIVCDNDKMKEIPMYAGIPINDWEQVKKLLELSLNIEIKKEGEIFIAKSID